MNEPVRPVFAYRAPVYIDDRLVDPAAEAIRQALFRAYPDNYIDIRGDERFAELATDIIDALEGWTLVADDEDNT